MSTLHADAPALSLDEINALDEPGFVAAFGPLFELSPWIARQTWPRRPFASAADLLAKLSDTLRRSSPEKQLALIQAHPDLAGRLARLGRLTRDSSQEQASAGLDRLTPEESQLFQEQNQLYMEKFDFPFVICARLNDKNAILVAFERRLQSSREVEIQTALAEIEKIAALRLAPLIKE
jgi:2-oxo-4-hydroxy-4-carboxy-5-ureidoimidazoline decarboxylase